MKNNIPALPEKNSWWKENWFSIIIISTGLSILASLFLIRVFIVQPFKIPSSAMTPTLLSGDYILADKTYSDDDIKRKDIIIFTYPENKKLKFVKRVIGLPGDRIEIKNKQLYINSKKQNESYVTYKDTRKIIVRDNFGPIQVPQNSLFVLGDNRDNSHDSRFWGYVNTSAVKARVTRIYWSLDMKKGGVRWSRIGDKVL